MNNYLMFNKLLQCKEKQLTKSGSANSSAHVIFIQVTLLIQRECTEVCLVGVVEGSSVK